MQKQSSHQEQIKQMEILYLGLITGQLLIFLLLFFFVGDAPAEQADGGVIGGSTMVIAIAIFCLTSIGAGFMLYNKRKEEGRRLQGSVGDKLVHYRTGFLLCGALIEGANLVALIIHFFIEKNMIYLVLFAIGIGAFLLIRPTTDRIIEDYQLSATEQSELRNSLN